MLTSDADLTDIAELNPFRYRGYYYDTESGLYYLNSRYYDPETGRFINADAYVSTGQGLSGNNMFAYCLNNPIIRGDVDGEASITVIAGAIVGGFYGAMSALATKEASIGSVLVSTAVGAVTGAFNAWIGTSSLLVKVYSAGITGMINSFTAQASSKWHVNAGEMFKSGIVYAWAAILPTPKVGTEMVNDAFGIITDGIVNTAAYGVNNAITIKNDKYESFYKNNDVATRNGPTTYGWNRWA